MTVWRPVPKAIAAMAAAGSVGFATAPFPTWAAEPPSGPAGLDPTRAVHDVFQDHLFWWKRLEPEPRSVSTSWLESVLRAVLDVFGRVLQFLWELIAKILASLSGVFSGDASSVTVVVWLLVAALLAWSIGKLYPLIVRWLRGSAPVPATQEEGGWQMLAEASDLFEQAGQAFRDGLHAESIRLALLALIARLQKPGLLRYDPARTNREYQRDLGHRTELATGFGQLARIYERVWYGRVPAGRAEAEQAIGLCGSLINREDLAPD